jgi:hypothetical protein
MKTSYKKEDVETPIEGMYAEESGLGEGTGTRRMHVVRQSIICETVRMVSSCG